MKKKFLKNENEITVRNDNLPRASGRRRILWFLILVAVVLVIFGLSLLMREKESSDSSKLSTFAVRRDDLKVTVTESGSIKARNTIDVKSEVEGQATIVSIVPEGSYITQENVKNGKVLVELDSSNLKEQLTQREIDFASAEASFAETKENYDIQLKQNESDITEAELKVKFALMDFKKYLGEVVSSKYVEATDQVVNPTGDIASLLGDPNLGGSALQRLNELRDSIKMAESKLERAADTLEWTRKLHEKQYVSDTELKADELDVQSLDIQRQQADMALELFKRYDFPKQVEQLLSDYKEAERELVRTEARARSRLAQAEARLNSSKAQLNQREERLERVKRQIAACTIKAPAPGLVVYGTSGDPWRRRDRGLIEEGGTVFERQTIIELPNTAEMMAEISVHESSVDKVKPGQKAIITIDAFPDEKFSGEVIKVALLPDAQRGWLSPDLKVYATQVLIVGSNESLKPGMSAKVEILVEQLDDVLIVPVQVVANREGKKLCYVMASNIPEPREVRTGAFNDTYVQIVSGLTEGEQVLLNPPRVVEQPAVALATEEPKQAGKPPIQSGARIERGERVQAGERKPEGIQVGEGGPGPGFGGPGSPGGPGGMGAFPRPSQEEMEKFKKRWEGMSAEEREKFMAQMREKFNQRSRAEQE